MTLRYRLVSILILCAIVAAIARCGSEADPTPGRGGTPPDPSPVTPPSLTEAFTPQLSEETERALAESDRGVRAVVHVVVHQDGTPGEVTVKSSDPASLPLAQGFAEDVARSLRNARYRPAMRAGHPVDSEFDFAIEVGGGRQSEPAAP